MDYNKLSLEMHEKNKGKLSVISKIKVETKDDLSIAYTPGVAEPCRQIHKDVDLVYKYTIKSNTVAIVSDGTAVLGLGDIGPDAAIPVMEGKAVLFKEFGDVDAFPICLRTTDVDEIVRTIKLFEPVFGGINLEDIAAPRCFEIEKRLKEELNIPIFHDDQHGTAIVVASALINGSKVAKKDISSLNVVINGAGSAGIAIAKLLMKLGVNNIVLCGRHGIILESDEKINSAQREMAKITNKYKESGTLKDAIVNKDVFIGVSVADVLTADMVSTMADKSMVFALANPNPEITPDEAKKGGAFIVGTGRSDYKNQINNVLAFPGIFRGALDVRASDINEEMKVAAALAIANVLTEDELSEDMILPLPFDSRIAKEVARKVSEAAIASKVAKNQL